MKYAYKYYKEMLAAGNAAADASYPGSDSVAT